MARFYYEYCSLCGVYRVKGSKSKITSKCKCDGLSPMHIIPLKKESKAFPDVYTYIKALQSDCSICGQKPTKKHIWTTTIGSMKPQYLRAIDSNNITSLGEVMCDKCYKPYLQSLNDNQALLYYTNLLFHEWAKSPSYSVSKQRVPNKPYFKVSATELSKDIVHTHLFPIKFWDDYFTTVVEELC